MLNARKIITVFLCLMIIFCGFAPQNFCYADSGEWVNVSNSEQYDAFLAYCKSRKVTIGGSIVDAATVVTTQLYQNAVATLGIDMNALQSALWKYQENNTTVKWGFQALGITAFNNILANILQNYNIEVGDENVDVPVKSGRWFTDADGNGCWVYVMNSGLSNPSSDDSNNIGDSAFSALGSAYKYSSEWFLSSYPLSYASSATLGTLTFNLTSSQSFTASVKRFSSAGDVSICLKKSSDSNSAPYGVINSNVYNSSGSHAFKHIRYRGNPAIIAVGDSLWFGTYSRSTLSYTGVNQIRVMYYRIVQIQDATAPDTSVTITSPKVKPPLDPPGGDDITVIDPDGNIPEPEPDPGGNIPDWTIPDSDVTPDGDGGFNFDWNFQLPDLNIDWSIQGLKDKFPFSIPFDLYDLVCILDAEPKTPEFETTIDFIVYEWDLDLDLHQFDNIAAIVRNLEFIGFLFGLILITRKIIKG